METNVLAACIGAVFGIILLLWVQVPLTNFGPLWSLRAWAKTIRFFKRGDKKPWDWTCLEEGVLYISTLPRDPKELMDLPNLGAVVTLNEDWEVGCRAAVPVRLSAPRSPLCAAQQGKTPI